MTIEMWPITRPLPYARNARKISDKAIEKVASSIKEFGWQQPIVVDKEGVIVVGHTRLKAAQKLSLTEVPVHVALALSPAQVKAYRLMDNRSNDEAKWDFNLLGPEMAELKGFDFDLKLTGFDAGEVMRFLNSPSAGLTDPDDTPDLAKTATTRPGDVWILGDHRLYCGDCTQAPYVEAVLNGTKPNLMVTDPPYGVDYSPAWRDGVGEFADGKIAMSGKVANDERADWYAAWVLFPGNVAYVWSASLTCDQSIISLERAKLIRRNQIIWVKPHFQMSRGHYHWQHEPCWYTVREHNTASWQGSRKQTTVWEISGMNPAGGTKKAEDAKIFHGTQKPVECMRRPMENSSLPGDIVYDPFLGSGTTIIAAQMSGRKCYGLEIDPFYCDLIVKRWEAFAGGHARLESSGQGFAEVEAERKGGNVQ